MVGGEGRCVKVINLANWRESNKSNDDVDGVCEWAQEDDAEDFGRDTTQTLHQSYDESVEWIWELFGVIRNILHHLKSLTHIAFYLHVHEDWADEASSQDWQILWKQNHKTFCASEADNSKDHNQYKLNEEYEERGLESFVNFVIVQFHLFHIGPI